MSSNLRKELITTIRSLSNVFFKINKLSKINFFLFGIILKFSITFIKLNIVKVSSLFKKTLIFITLIFFITFYSPLFWYLGKPLLYHDTFNEYKDIKNIVVFSGHGSTSYYNMTYLYRYRDIIKYSIKIVMVKYLF